jgi:hypothetical protein
MAEPPRRFPTPWHADPMPGGSVVRDANGQALAYLYSRENEDEARQAKVLTGDEARRIAVNIARAEVGATAALTRAIAVTSANLIVHNMVCTPLWVRMRVLLILPPSWSRALAPFASARCYKLRARSQEAEW